MPGLRKFDEYVYNTPAYTFSGRRLYEILDSFAASLQRHLTDEIVWILSLNRYKNLDLAAIDLQHGLYVKAHSSRLRLLPYLLTNHDLTYEGGIHSWWPSGNKARDLFLRYICTMWHRGAWRYSACTLAGKPRPLQGIKWERTEPLRVETAVMEMEQGRGPLQLPEKAHTKEAKDETADHSRTPSSSYLSTVPGSPPSSRTSVTRLV
jgi:hypothetical protein